MAQDLDFQVFNHFSDMMRRLYFRLHLLAGEKLPQIQLGYLHYLYDHEGCTQQDFADMLTASKTTVSGTLKQLEEEGLICRKRSETDRRKNAIFLTERGRVIAGRIREEYDAFCERALRDFTPREKRQMMDLLQRFMEAGAQIPD